MEKTTTSEHIAGLLDDYSDLIEDAFEYVLSDEERESYRMLRGELAKTRPLLEAAPDLLAALENLVDKIRAHHKMNVKKDYSLMVAEAAARKVIIKATTL